MRYLATLAAVAIALLVLPGWAVAEEEATEVIEIDEAPPPADVVEDVVIVDEAPEETPPPPPPPAPGRRSRRAMPT